MEVLQEVTDIKEDLKTLNQNLKEKSSNVRKSTHLFLHEKCLRAIPKIKNPTNIVKAYLHTNMITKIENLDGLCNVTHLHLRWNRIEKIEGLQNMYNLRKLFLDNNCIGVLENLQGLRFLEEIHISKQNVDCHDGLCFDPRTLLEIGGSLKYLDVGSNRISHLSWVRPLHCLQTLRAQHNGLHDYEEVADELCRLPCLRDVDLGGNPMAAKHRYRETIIARCPNIEVMDGVCVADSARRFMQGLERAGQQRRLHARQGYSDVSPLLCISPCGDRDAQGRFEHFFETNLGGPQTSSALCRRDPDARITKTAVTDSTYNMIPKCFYRNKSARAPPQPAPHAPAPASAPGDSLADELERALRPLSEPLRKGILKKPMPMKYL